MVGERLLINVIFQRNLYKLVQRSVGRRNMSNDCLFCGIAKGTVPETPLVYSDEEFAVFRDRKPAAEYHYLVVPKDHFGKVTSLENEQSEMISRMEDVGKYVLANEKDGFNGVIDNLPENLPDALLGFHWPICLVGHLHMHVIHPASSMSFFNRNVVFSKKLSFGTSDMAIKLLEKKE